LLLGLQHLFIMYAGAVAVPLIVGPAVGLDKSDIALLVSADLLVSGIASVLQSVGVSRIIGVRMPVARSSPTCPPRSSAARPRSCSRW
jgi:NCS2 family nucleobase:cation symporter-2